MWVRPQMRLRWRTSPCSLLPKAVSSAGRKARSCVGREGLVGAADSGSSERPPVVAAASDGWLAVAQPLSPQRSASCHQRRSLKSTWCAVTETLFKYKSGLCQLTCLSGAGPRLVLITLRDLSSPHTQKTCHAFVKNNNVCVMTKVILNETHEC